MYLIAGPAPDAEPRLRGGTKIAFHEFQRACPLRILQCLRFGPSASTMMFGSRNDLARALFAGEVCVDSVYWLAHLIIYMVCGRAGAVTVSDRVAPEAFGKQIVVYGAYTVAQETIYESLHIGSGTGATYAYVDGRLLMANGDDMAAFLAAHHGGASVTHAVRVLCKCRRVARQSDVQCAGCAAVPPRVIARARRRLPTVPLPYLCWHCCEVRVMARLACAGCDRATYCGAACRDAAARAYHAKECTPRA